MRVSKTVKKTAAKTAPAKAAGFIGNIFSPDDTNFMKGIALFFLLWHHLFFLSPSAGTATLWGGVRLAYFAAVVMKVCVAMFLLLSGYGLFVSGQKHDSLPVFSFWRKSYAKIYLNYWLIWAIFVTAGILFFPGGTLAEAYGAKSVVSTAILNFLGLQNIFRLPSYNQAWWFISVIFVMYAMFPLLRFSMRRLGRASFVVPAAFFALQFTAQYTGRIPYINIPFITNWAFPFVFGMWLAQNNVFARTKDFDESLSTDGRVLHFFIYIAVIGALVWQRQYGYGAIKSFYIDGILAFFIINFLNGYFTGISWLKSAMLFAGRHSFNIFLFHNIIYETYFPKAFYELGSPVAAFAALMSVSIVVSIMLERLKGGIGFYKLQGALAGK
ncbi:MAG: acyltransferase [Rickettsiales bacterium]|jgi:peptidoglycan/LPS O-acetylase OafA/YrhL|nr:acyltransferase [Rickettsiales bacterium]